MKKLLLSFVVLPGALATAQVGINTDEPKAMLDISAKDDQKGDLRIQDVEEKSTQWLLVWDEKDQKVKRTSLSREIPWIKWELENEDKIKHIRDKQPKRADDITHKIKQCAPENILFDKHFGDGKHDFVYCATTVTETATNYNKTWLNLNLGAEYADINSPHFNPTVSKTSIGVHNEAKTYGSLYQWQRASDGHEFRDSETTDRLADTWTETGEAARKFITSNDGNWVVNGGKASGSDLQLWQAGGANNPCPSGYHVPTVEEWQELLNAIGSNEMWSQNKLPNLATAGHDGDYIGSPCNGIYCGYYWSSSASHSSGAHYMNLGSDNSGTYGYYNRTYGFSVRCIKDNN